MDPLFSPNLDSYQQVNKKLQSRNLKFCDFRSLPTIQKLLGKSAPHGSKEEQKEDKCSPRQLRHLDHISQFTTDIQHVKGIDNVVAEALSMINIITIETPSHIDFREIVNNQKSDKELSEILAHPDKSSLVLQLFPVNNHAIELYCYVASDRIRPFVSEGDRKKHFSVCILFHILGLRLLSSWWKTIRMV
ncbi:RT_RNaseH_2 domain-containing protein [Caerostris extrusa]|uniref:RT_RNaseH_2 domain-containing protein n=1 Tax=Caerostris extrusa TaxID=172846 RepID=A0AAV4TTM8_CAEEX|nr:RT_RNaseH_2 domain-containing protein [Caerostris extrusa]